jgi:tRNA(Leu) C34 or U34 (ribose-2'-O)-methylase TrmL
MDQRVVSNLERKIKEAIADTIMKMRLRRLPLMPSQQTMHLMAKAALSVYEAAAQASGESE